MGGIPGGGKDLPLNQMKQEGQFSKDEGHHQEEAGGWLWLAQALEKRDCGSGLGLLEDERGSLSSPQTKPVCHPTPQTLVVDNEGCHFLIPPSHQPTCSSRVKTLKIYDSPMGWSYI